MGGILQYKMCRGTLTDQMTSATSLLY